MIAHCSITSLSLRQSLVVDMRRDAGQKGTNTLTPIMQFVPVQRRRDGNLEP